MSLRIRRGTDAQRATTSLDMGEVVYTTDTKQLYVGNGIDNGGVPIIRLGTGLAWADVACTTIIATGAALQVSADATPSLGGNLNLNSKTITGTGTIDITGNVKGTTLTGNLTTTTGTTIINGTTRAATLSRITLDTNGSITSPAILVDSASVTFVTNTFSATSPYINFYVASSLSDQTGSIGLIRSRGTTISPSAVVNGDEIGSIVASGFSGSQFTFSTDIVAVVDGTVSAGVVPSRLDLKVSNTAGVRATAMSIKATQVDFIVPPKLPVAATDAARAALVPTPSTGMMIFMTSGTAPAATNKVQVYDSTAWVNLH